MPVRVCVVGCGAVGGALRGQPRAARRRRGLGLRRLRTTHVRAINEHGLRLSGAGDVVGRLRATSDPAELPACDFGIVATKSMHTGDAVAAVAHAFADGSVCSVQNGVGNEEAIAEHVERVIRGTTFPAGKVLEPGHVQWDVKGDTTIGPFEPRPAAMDEIERLAEACTRAGMPTEAVADARGPAVAQADLQRGDEPDRRADGPDARAGLRGPCAARARQRPRRRGEGGRRGAGDRAGRGSRAADRPRGQARRGLRPQGEHAPGRRGADGRPRSTS